MTQPGFVLNQVDIEGEIVRLSSLLEQATDQLAVASRLAAEKEADYRSCYASDFYSPHDPGVEKWTEKLRESYAVNRNAALLKDRLIAEAARDSLQEKCRQLRAQLDAVRTLSANVRVQV